MRKKSLALASLVVVGGLILAACGGNDDDMSDMSGMGSSTPTTSSTDAAPAEFNEADVEFATNMIPHHQQAVEMAELAETQAESPEVKELADTIKNAQDPEIETMTGWLTAWGEPAPQDMSGMDMSVSMPGMMSMDDTQMLEDASGDDFDRMFLTMMIEHHQGAIEMARTEQESGSNAAAIQLAEDIETAQKAEIKTMKGLLN